MKNGPIIGLFETIPIQTFNFVDAGYVLHYSNENFFEEDLELWRSPVSFKEKVASSESVALETVSFNQNQF